MTQNSLQTVLSPDMITYAKVEELYHDMRKETMLKSVLDLDKIKYREQINQFYIVIHRKQYTAKSRQELINKLYLVYFGDNTITLEQAYTEWMLWRRNIGTCSKTLKENKNEWIHFIDGTELSQKCVVKLTIHDFEDYLYEITKNYAITSKRLSNILSVLNGIMKRCVSRGIIQHNILSDVDKKIFHNRCKSSKSNKENYTLEERKQILDYLSDKNDMYSLAIRLSFYLCLRIGELCAIKYEDIQGNYLYIQRSKRSVETMYDDLSFSSSEITNDTRIKGNRETGFRKIPLTPKAKDIVELTHSLYPDGEFLFMRDGKQLIGDTFNEELKRVCDKLNITYHSSHQIRFTVATMLYSNGGVSLSQLSFMLGHADTATTLHYIRKQEPSPETIGIMNQLLD